MAADVPRAGTGWYLYVVRGRAGPSSRKTDACSLVVQNGPEHKQNQASRVIHSAIRSGTDAKTGECSKRPGSVQVESRNCQEQAGSVTQEQMQMQITGNRTITGIL